MLFPFKKLLLSFIINSCLFLLLIIVIQNSKRTSKVNLISNETVNLPISFILGSSFIAGSIFGSFLSINFDKK